MSGGIACVDVVVENQRIKYVGAAKGGIWKSINGGVTWKPIFDNQTTSSIGDITIDVINDLAGLILPLIAQHLNQTSAC